MDRVIERLQLWIDDEARAGPANMAVDEWLLRHRDCACLRVYRWHPGWASRGYFVAGDEAQRLLPGRQWVRRWTGGGVVDHAADWTYTLVVPRGEALTELRGGGSYRVVHAALAEALAGAGLVTGLAAASGVARGGVCFERAVEFDLLGSDGRKLAGAGQRRTREGLLHQGSVAGLRWPGPADALAAALAVRVGRIEPRIDAARVARIARERYAGEAWNAGPRRARVSNSRGL